MSCRGTCETTAEASALMGWTCEGYRVRQDETFVVPAPSEFAGWKTGYGPECGCEHPGRTGVMAGTADGRSGEGYQPDIPPDGVLAERTWFAPDPIQGGIPAGESVVGEQSLGAPIPTTSADVFNVTLAGGLNVGIHDLFHIAIDGRFDTTIDDVFNVIPEMPPGTSFFHHQRGGGRPTAAQMQEKKKDRCCYIVAADGSGPPMTETHKPSTKFLRSTKPEVTYWCGFNFAVRVSWDWRDGKGGACKVEWWEFRVGGSGEIPLGYDETWRDGAWNMAYEQAKPGSAIEAEYKAYLAEVMKGGRGSFPLTDSGTIPSIPGTIVYILVMAQSGCADGGNMAMMFKFVISSGGNLELTSIRSRYNPKQSVLNENGQGDGSGVGGMPAKPDPNARNDGAPYSTWPFSPV